MVKSPLANAGDVALIPGLGRFPGEGNGNPLQYSCLENPTDGGAWRGHKESDMTEQLSIACVLGTFKHAVIQRKERGKKFLKDGGDLLG